MMVVMMLMLILLDIFVDVDDVGDDVDAGNMMQ